MRAPLPEIDLAAVRHRAEGWAPTNEDLSRPEGKRGTPYSFSELRLAAMTLHLDSYPKGLMLWAAWSMEDIPLLLAELERRDLAEKALKALVKLEAGRIQRLRNQAPHLSSKAEMAQARAWADAVEALA